MLGSFNILARPARYLHIPMELQLESPPDGRMSLTGEGGSRAAAFSCWKGSPSTCGGKRIPAQTGAEV